MAHDTPTVDEDRLDQECAKIMPTNTHSRNVLKLKHETGVDDIMLKVKQMIWQF